MRELGLVAAGGAVGTLARYGLDSTVAATGHVPTSTLLVNVVGSLLIGVLLGQSLPDRLRLLTCTGVLGGFTTYSALAVQTQDLLVEGHPVVGLAYTIGSVAAGVAVAAAGLRWSRR